MNFDEAFDRLIGHEGGYSNHPSDPGGETMWGVTARVARVNGYQGDMRALPRDLAKAIYRKAYWLAVKADDLPERVRFDVFDAAVNSGTTQAAKWLQRAVGVPDDGMVGAQTIGAARAANPEVVVRRMLGQRLRFMAGLTNWPAFSRGWARRIADLMEAV